MRDVLFGVLVGMGSILNGGMKCESCVFIGLVCQNGCFFNNKDYVAARTYIYYICLAEVYICVVSRGSLKFCSLWEIGDLGNQLGSQGNVSHEIFYLQPLLIHDYFDISASFRPSGYPKPNLPPHSLPNSTTAHSAFPSAATPESPTVSTPSKPTSQSIPLPTIHLLIAPTVASIAAVPYPQSSSIFKASTLFATTAHPKLLAAAGTSYSQMTMRIGNSFVEDETRRAVDTEFGRVYFGRRPKNTRGENGEEVRKRMERWKLRVDRAHSIRKNMY